MADPVIYLARHATPDWTRTDIPYHTPPGPPLTEQGRAEAQALGAYLAREGVRRIYASPLERAQHTAELAGAVMGAPVEIVWDIREWELQEAEEAVGQRMWTFWQRVVAESRQEGPIALVSHGGPIRILLERLGVEPERLASYRTRFDGNNPLPPAGVWKASRQGQGWSARLDFVPGKAQETPG